MIPRCARDVKASRSIRVRSARVRRLARPTDGRYVPVMLRARWLPSLAALSLAALSLAFFAACGSLSIRRQTETSGTFVSTGWAFTILSLDIPKSSNDIARENASDSRLANLRIEENKTTPYLGWWDWLLDIIGVRRTKITGTWGFAKDS